MFDIEVVLPPEVVFPTLQVESFEEETSERGLRENHDFLQSRGTSLNPSTEKPLQNYNYITTRFDFDVSRTTTRFCIRARLVTRPTQGVSWPQTRKDHTESSAPSRWDLPASYNGWKTIAKDVTYIKVKKVLRLRKKLYIIHNPNI
ncbi:hypothetical protein BHE74_00050381 [Ensete ventricosum]|nr:hypothetical protein BHE74_00050381 [Ensete ventricosum]